MNKLFNIQEHEFEEPINKEIKSKQAATLQGLIEKLGPNVTEEDNLNASSILQDVLENNKDFYSIICKKNNIQQLINLAFSEEQNSSSQNSALAVLVALVQIYHEKKKDQEKKRGDDEEEDSTVQATSDEEDAANVNPLVDVLSNNIRKISEYLNSGNSIPQTEIDTSYDLKIVPLGHFRLRIVDLVYHLLKLRNEKISNGVLDTELLPKISLLLENYPWNNFLQLKVIALYEEIFENGTKEFKQAALSKSNIIDTLTKLGGITKFEH